MLNLGYDSEARFGQYFKLKFRYWCLVEIMKLMQNRYSEFEIWSRLVYELAIWTQPSCVWQCLLLRTVALKISPVLFMQRLRSASCLLGGQGQGQGPRISRIRKEVYLRNMTYNYSNCFYFLGSPGHLLFMVFLNWPHWSVLKWKKADQSPCADP